MGGAGTIFWIKSVNGTFLALQINSFGSQKTKLHAGVKGAILVIFHDRLEWLCPVSAAFNNPSQELKISFCFGCRYIPRKTGWQN